MKAFSFCESALATSMSPWHIRALTKVGKKISGGIDTPSLCGRVTPMGPAGGFGGWDLQVKPPTDGEMPKMLERGIVCTKCAEQYKKEIGP